MLNQITIQGRLVADPELKTTTSGVSLCGFCVAVERDYQQDRDNKVSDFINCTAWRGTAEFVANYFRKGRLIIVTGSLEQRRFQDKDGNNRSAYEVQAQHVYFGDSKRNDDDAPAKNYTAPAADVDDSLDLPF